MQEGDSPWLDHYVKFDCVEKDLVRQRNGQLMGHVLSFPILCIANYIMFKYTFWKLDKKAPNVLINGDDVLFACTKDDYKSWCGYCKSVGLIPSLGKNLFQTDIAQINSVLFSIRFSDQLGIGFEFVRNIQSVPYVNFGILTGRGKGKENPFERTSQLEAMRDLDEFQPEIVSLHSVLQIWKYTESLYDTEILKKIFYSHRPIVAPMLKELEDWNPLVVARLFVKSGHSDFLPGNSTSVYRSICGEWTFKPKVVLRELGVSPYLFEERTLDIVERTKVC
jgi:hypothetical protein